MRRAARGGPLAHASTGVWIWQAGLRVGTRAWHTPRMGERGGPRSLGTIPAGPRKGIFHRGSEIPSLCRSSVCPESSPIQSRGAAPPSVGAGAGFNPVAPPSQCHALTDGRRRGEACPRWTRIAGATWACFAPTSKGMLSSHMGVAGQAFIAHYRGHGTPCPRRAFGMDRRWSEFRADVAEFTPRASGAGYKPAPTQCREPVPPSVVIRAKHAELVCSW